MRRRNQRGTTLVETLAATVILSVISFALTESLVSGLNNAGDTQERLTGSIDRQRLAAAFYPDVQSTKEVDASPPTDFCGAPIGVGNKALAFLTLWPDGTKMTDVAYLVVDGELVRRECQGAGSPGDDEALAEVGDDFVVKFVELDQHEPAGDDSVALRICPDAPSNQCAIESYVVPRSGVELVATRRVP